MHSLQRRALKSDYAVELATADEEAGPILAVQNASTAPQDKKRTADGGVEKPFTKSFLQAWPAWFRVARLWFQAAEVRQACAWTMSAIVLSLVTTVLLVQISYVQRDFETAMAGKNQGGFHKAIKRFLHVILWAAPLFALSDFVENRLVLEWRRWLTKTLLKGYFANRAYFQLHYCMGLLDNPDQRMCDDVPTFTDSSVTLVIGLVRKVFIMCAFAGVLYNIAPELVVFLLAYSLAGTGLTIAIFGKKLMRLQYSILSKEGDLRFGLVRARENSESIAFYQGERREEHNAVGRLMSLVGTCRRRLLWEAGLTTWTQTYSYAVILLPYLLVAPRYFAGSIEFGVITQVGYAFNRIETAVNYIVTNLEKFSALGADTERLDALLQAIDQMGKAGSSGGQIRRGEGERDSLLLQDVVVTTPSGSRTLCLGLSLHIQPGQSLLIMGASGCGKSSLLRAISGLWTAGSGKICTPPASQMFFLPQKPFMPLGNLRQQLLFPSDLEEEGDFPCATSSGQIDDAALLALLEKVHLPGLADRVGGLGAEVEWAHVLSLGEQQRVAFARLLVRRPRLAFLDEATGALDGRTEAALYGALAAHVPAYVSVGHRLELLQFHTHVLHCETEATWRLYTSDEFKSELLGPHDRVTL